MRKAYIFIIGTRAQLIKVAPVVVECERRNLNCVLLMTGQHLETMQDLFEEFGIRSSQVSAVVARERATVGALLTWLPAAYFGIRKQLGLLSGGAKNVDILVHGDTLSTVVGALAGRSAGGRIIHLESGLTSNRIFDPFPEEVSRRLVFRMSHVAMCPSPEATRHIQQKFPKCKAVETHGNTIVDSVALVRAKQGLATSGEPYVVASLHRFQNIYSHDRLSYLVNLLQNISKKYPIHFVLHPATRKKLVSFDLLRQLQGNPKINLSPRLGYGDFLRLASAASCVLTDGGSNQEELAALGVPTIVMRQTTERNDGLGANAILEQDVPGGVEGYMVEAAFSTLKRPARTLSGKTPSQWIVDFITGDGA